MIEPLELAALVEKLSPHAGGKAASLKSAIRFGVTERVLKPNDELPSTRRAAEVLSMSRNSVIEAYEGLQAEGVIETRPGARPRICELPNLEPLTPRQELAIGLSHRGQLLSEDYRSDHVIGRVEAFAPGLPDPNLFPRDEWALCLRRVARRDLRGFEHYEAYQGLPELRKAVALHLKRARGVSASPEQIFVVPNTLCGTALLCELMSDPGDEVAMEDPGYAGARALFQAKGLRVQALPRDLETGRPRPRQKLIYVTPSTQFPAGTRMQLRRRLDVLAYAEAHHSLILEDDYDGDFVWRGADVPPVFALDRTSSVALLSTLSKSVMPGIRMAWLVVPPRMIGDVQRAHRTLGLSVNVSVQAAMADFMTSGLFSRHLRSAARTYHDRMLCLTQALKGALGQRANLSLPDGGLQVLLRLPPTADDKRISDLLWTRGFEVQPLSRLCIARQDQGLVIGFARADERNSKKLGAAIAETLALF